MHNSQSRQLPWCRHFLYSYTKDAADKKKTPQQLYRSLISLTNQIPSYPFREYFKRRLKDEYFSLLSAKRKKASEEDRAKGMDGNHVHSKDNSSQHVISVAELTTRLQEELTRMRRIVTVQKTYSPEQLLAVEAAQDKLNDLEGLVDRTKIPRSDEQQNDDNSDNEKDKREEEGDIVKSKGGAPSTQESS